MLESRIGLLFAGQGSQITKLGEDFYHQFPSVKELYDQYPHIRDMAFNASEEEIAKTQNTQRLLTLFQVAVTDLLKEHYSFAAAMGISLGEYGALYAAEVLNQADVISIIEQRADSMAAASSTLPLKSVAVLNSDFSWLTENAGQDSYYISNINSPSQMVITGQEMDVWTEKILAKGYKRVIPLAVSGGFHSPYMHPTETLLKQLFQNITFSPEKIPVYFNYGTPEMDIKTRMAEQVSHTIDVHRSLEQIVAECDILIEIGANSILQNMVKKIDRQKTILPLKSVEDFEKVRQTIGN